MNAAHQSAAEPKQHAHVLGSDDALKQTEQLPNKDAQCSSAEIETDKPEINDESETNAEYEPISVVEGGSNHLMTHSSPDKITAQYPLIDSPEFPDITAVGSPANPPTDQNGRPRVEDEHREDV